MIYRNFIAPSRAFSQFAHELIRHPRLSSDAVRLLTWQLSLPQGAKESLSRTAERARIGSCAFTRAKRELMAEGFVHERRVQGAGGLWETQQLISSTPLSPGEAAKILAGTPVRTSTVRTSTVRASSQVAPGHGIPAAGEPEAPSTGGHPKKHPEGDTSNLPSAAAEPDGPDAPDRAVDEHLDEAQALVGALPLLSPVLRHIPPVMHQELKLLATRWLAAGHSSADVHEHILRGLPGTGTPVHRPGGLVRYLLREVVPRTPVPTPASTPPRPQLSARLVGTRECTGAHDQATLFRPVADESLCASCTHSQLSGR
ncbi:hypothetical protein Q5762_33905 [Streptomyces sp. P9(2023)]|uniref:hypothetical protein n=1 Tax=Streptomyces sp. P9(2023) TaxID=3064394 RepID=UPI0028F45851|nr:hypothetical protein [Streptomyces sp. P9(2023)]MDT9693234.1 hypothetical protein [Streptomyces sp. P9(2023)]